MKAVSIVWRGVVTEDRGLMSECASTCLQHRIYTEWQTSRQRIPWIRRIVSASARRKHRIDQIPPQFIVTDAP